MEHLLLFFWVLHTAVLQKIDIYLSVSQSVCLSLSSHVETKRPNEHQNLNFFWLFQGQKHYSRHISWLTWTQLPWRWRTIKLTLVGNQSVTSTVHFWVKDLNSLFEQVKINQKSKKNMVKYLWGPSLVGMFFGRKVLTWRVTESHHVIWIIFPILCKVYLKVQYSWRQGLLPCFFADAWASCLNHLGFQKYFNLFIHVYNEGIK